MKSLAGPAASLRHPKGGSAAVSGSQAEEDTSPPGPPSGGADADDDRGAHLLDAWESAMDRANGHPVDGLPRGDIDAPDPETRLKRTIAQERAERATPRQLPLGVPPEVQARLEQCSWYTDPDGRYELPPDRKARPRRPRFQPQVVPPPPVERDIGWERRKAALGELAELVPAKEESDEG